MKSRNLHLIITLILAFLSAYFIYDAISTRKLEKESRKRIKQSHSIIIHFEKQNDSLERIILTKKKRIDSDSLKLELLKESNSTYFNQIKSTKRAYSELLRQMPKNTKDSLQNYKKREVILLTENRSLDKSNNNLREQVKVLEFSMIGAKEIIRSQDLIIKNDSVVKQEFKKVISELENRVKNSKRNRRKGWLEGGVVGILIGILFL